MRLTLILATATLAVASAQRYVAAPAHYKVRDEASEDRRTHPASANYDLYRPVAAAAQPAEDTGFVHPIDFSGLLRDSILGSEAVASPAFGVGGAPLHLTQASASPFQPSGRLFPAFGIEQDKAATQEDKGFVEPEAHFRSFFDGGSAGGFQIKDFLTAHASSQKEVEDRVNAAASGADDYREEEEEEGPSAGGRRGSQAGRKGSDEGRRAAATEHKVYHDEEEEEAEDEGSDSGRVTKPKTGGSSGSHYADSGYHYRPQSHYYPQHHDSGPQTFGSSRVPYSSSASSKSESEKIAEKPYYGPDYSKIIEEEAAAVEEESAGTSPKGAAKKGGKNCKKVSKKVTAEDVGKGRFRRAARGKPAMTCYVCEDPANGGSFESCAYGSSPSDKSYFVSRAYSSKGKNDPKISKYRNRRYLPEARIEVDEQQGDAFASGTSNEENKEEAPEYEEAATGGLDAEKMAYEAIPGDSYDENFKRLFPEFNYREASASSPAHQSSSPSLINSEEEEEEEGDGNKRAEATEEEKATDYGYQGAPEKFYLDQAQKKHLEKLVGEFSQKDRTACKKLMKDKMTCFQCIDEKGMQHEECMFVAKSDPKGRHLAYHELKEYRLVPDDGDALGGASEHSPEVYLFPHPLVKDLDVSTTSLVNAQRVPAPSTAASESRRNVEELGGRRQRRKGRGEEEREGVVEEEVEEEEEQGGAVRATTAEEEAIADGVYADETVQTFDPIRKIHLPKYMLKKSEHEAVFEEFVKSSHDEED